MSLTDTEKINLTRKLQKELTNIERKIDTITIYRCDVCGNEHIPERKIIKHTFCSNRCKAKFNKIRRRNPKHIVL